ncbi:MAG TPA: hypothetical protein VKI65_15940 [Gemmataceae bacterium]|nr:hypothetical protein [Gemmataceae bacterium]
MTCPPEIAEIIAEIIKSGVLRIRSAGWSGDANRCATEADHIHNLPSILNHYSTEALRYYWEIERPAFISQTSPDELASLAPLWEKLSHFAARPTEPSLAR